MIGLSKIYRFFTPAEVVLVDKIQKLNLSEVAVFGMGDLGIAVVQRLSDRGVRLSAWYDSTIIDNGHRFMGHHIYPPSSIVEHDIETLVIASEAFESDIKTQCKKIGYSGQLIGLSD